MEAKFKNGPWQVVKLDAESNCEYVSDCHGTPICNLFFESNSVNYPIDWYVICEANARLIAAAPEMYEMLEGLAEGISNRLGSDYAGPILELLAKARGES